MAQTQIHQETKQNDVKVYLYIDLRLFSGYFLSKSHYYQFKKHSFMAEVVRLNGYAPTRTLPQQSALNFHLEALMSSLRGVALEQKPLG